MRYVINSGYGISQLAYHAPTVFNFFKPSYVPPLSDLAAQQLVAPEFQLTNEYLIFKYIDNVTSLNIDGISPCVADYSSLLKIAADSQVLLDEINLVIAAGQIGFATLSSYKTALDTIVITDKNSKLTRIYAAITLVMSAPEFIILK